jgi:beta-N-acetylhexosaminidase
MYISGMTLEEQIGQLLMVGFWGTTPSPEIIDLIQRYHVGNIILFSRNIRDARQVLELTQSLQMIAKEAGQRHPLLIAIDQENGIVQRLGEAVTIFPGNMALGAIFQYPPTDRKRKQALTSRTSARGRVYMKQPKKSINYAPSKVYPDCDKEEIAYRVALATGHELKALGINMNLAPVVDVNNNPANPVIGVRSFGEDPQQVARLGAAMVKGYHEAGIFSCLKHFPGHGDTAIDSHLALPTIPHTLERLEALELVPFRSGIEAGAESVMIAHVSFPALTGQDTLPATLSSTIVQGLLREQPGFKGIILSDCMEMKAISETFGTERAAIMALQAGIDLVLVSHHYAQQRGSIEEIQAAIGSGELSSQAIQQAAEQVLRLKESDRKGSPSLSWNDLPTSTTISDCIGCEAHIQLQNQAYELSTTLVRNEDALLPLHLNSGEHIIVLSPQRNTATMVEDRYYTDDVLVNVIERYHPDVRLLPVVAGEEAHGGVHRQLSQTTSEADIFIVATVNAHLDEQQAELVRYLVSSGRRIIGIAVRNPYDLQAFPELRTYLVTYEYTRPALVGAVRVIFGNAGARGRLPVKIAGV